MCRIGFDLFAQLVHECAKVLDLISVIRSPHRLHSFVWATVTFG